MSLTNTLLAIAFGATINPSVVSEVSYSNQYKATEFVLYCNSNMRANFMAILEDNAGIATAFFRDGVVKAIKNPGEKAKVVGVWSEGPTPDDITITSNDGDLSIITDLDSKKCDYHFTK